MKIASVIGKAVWNQRGDIHDVISIGKLVRKNDGPEEEQIVSTMTKYGGIRWKRKRNIGIVPLNARDS